MIVRLWVPEGRRPKVVARGVIPRAPGRVVDVEAGSRIEAEHVLSAATEPLPEPLREGPVSERTARAIARAEAEVARSRVTVVREA